MEQDKRHGGARQGAGRKPVDLHVKAERLIEELIVPALVYLVERKPDEQWVTIGYDEIQITYGKLAVDLWKVWFIPITKGTGFGKGLGGRKTEWSLNPHQYTKALELIQDRVNVSTFPTEKMKEAINRQKYKEYTRAHKEDCEDMGIAHHEVCYVPYTDGLSALWNDRYAEMNADFSKNARMQRTYKVLGWLELIDPKLVWVLKNRDIPNVYNF